MTVGFGVTTSDKCPDTSGAYKNVSVVHLLADMATDSHYDACNDTENTDGDHFFCLPKSSQLNGIFQTAAVALGGAPRLMFHTSCAGAEASATNAIRMGKRFNMRTNSHRRANRAIGVPNNEF